VDVVALLPPPLLAHLRLVIAREHDLRVAAHWREVEGIVRREAVDAVVVDPAPGGVSRVDEVRALIAAHPSVPVIAYTTLTPQAMRAIVTLAQGGLEHVVLHRFDDEPRRFLGLLERLPGHALGEELLRRLAARAGRSMADLPHAVWRAVERLVRTPNRFLGADDLAAAAGVTKRTLYRQFEAAGFASPRTMVLGARLLRAYAYLRDPGSQIDGVAAKLGYSAPRILSRQIQEVTGLSPSELRGRLEPAVLLRLLAERMHPG
jgi:AraC-like DNA-binding protein